MAPEIQARALRDIRAATTTGSNAGSTTSTTGARKIPRKGANTGTDAGSDTGTETSVLGQAFVGERPTSNRPANRPQPVVETVRVYGSVIQPKEISVGVSFPSRTMYRILRYMGQQKDQRETPKLL